MRKEEKTFPLFLLPPFLLFTLKFTGDDCSSRNNKRLLFSSFPRKQSFQAAIYSEKVEELGHRNSSVVADNQTAEIDLIRWLVSIQSVSLSVYPSYRWWAEIEQPQQANNPLSTLSLCSFLFACMHAYLLFSSDLNSQSVSSFPPVRYQFLLPCCSTYYSTSFQALALNVCGVFLLTIDKAMGRQERARKKRRRSKEIFPSQLFFEGKKKTSKL